MIDLIMVTRNNLQQYTTLLVDLKRQFEDEHRQIEQILCKHQKCRPLSPFNRQEFLSSCVDNDRRTFLIRSANNVVGYVIIDLFNFYFKTYDCHIDEIFILSQYRDHGYGYTTLKTIINWVKQKQLSHHKFVTLTVLRNNTAIKLYRKLGFKPCVAYLCPLYRINVTPSKIMTTRDTSKLITCQLNRLQRYFQQLKLPYKQLSHLYESSILIANKDQTCGAKIIESKYLMLLYCCQVKDLASFLAALHSQNIIQPTTSIIDRELLSQELKVMDVHSYFMYKHI